MIGKEWIIIGNVHDTSISSFTKVDVDDFTNILFCLKFS